MRKAVSAERYIEKIKPVLRKIKFSQLKIDDIAKYMDISKVTLYKHFSSKDEVIGAVVEHYTGYLLEADTIVKDDSVSFIERFQKTYEQSLKCVIYVSDMFLQDLKDSYPDLYENLAAAQQIRNKNLQDFFESGMERGIFNRLNAVLFMVQDDAVLRRIMEPLFSIQYDLTLKQALVDFYKMKKYQLIKPEYLDSCDDSVIEKEIAQILQTIS
ncbi:TetR/AcrR family transcriptional regulator [Paenibacillus alkalitolerans]|uniref:TetR/AcrR family transcriptional regulator n=1 Tax=Paenibacillus alkalitolerans TaxID=2799335 RepID=UPI0018F3004F|nr:TetR/AcrR family transcriptional regulator [Paenibacillus alkalitolerans]